MTKARAYKNANQERSSKVTFHALRNVRKCEGTLTFPRELLFWELEFQWIPEFSEGDFKGQIHWIEKFIKPLESSWNINV